MNHGGSGLSHYRSRLGWAVAAGTASAAANVALIGVSGWLIVRAADRPQLFTLLVAIVGVRAFSVARAGLRWVERMAAHDGALRVADETRWRLWAALARQGPAADRTPGHTLARLVGDVELLRDLSARVLIPPAVAAAATLATCVVLAVIAPAAGAAAAALIGAALAGAYLLRREVERGAGQREARLRGELLRQTTGLLDAAADLRAHGLAEPAADRLIGLGQRLDREAGIGTLGGALGVAAISAGTAIAGIVAAWFGISSKLPGPACAVLALAPLALVEPLAAAAAAAGRHAAWRDVTARLNEVLTAPSPTDPPAPGPALERVSGLSLVDAHAGWPGQPSVLSGVSAEVHRDADWLLVRGPSGSGKSTLLALVMAALRPRAGEYRLGGRSTQTLAGDDIRAAVAWCPQDAHIFASTIRANLSLALGPGGSVQDNRMWTVLDRVGLGKFVAGLPEGLDTKVGSGGIGLSGGQRRRLAVARTLLTERDVVLLDEPTAHLDPPAAHALIADLRLALRGKTVVCVTHDVTSSGGTVVDLSSRCAM